MKANLRRAIIALLAIELALIAREVVVIARANCDCLPWRRDVIHISQTPRGCRTLTTPEPWLSGPGTAFRTGWHLSPNQLPDRYPTPNRKYSTRYGIRRLGAAYLFELLDPGLDPGIGPARVSANCFQYNGTGLATCSTADWSRAEVLATPPQFRFPFPEGSGKRFFDYFGADEWSSPGVGMSMSYYGPDVESRAAFDFVTLGENLTPWTVQRLVVFEFYRRHTPTVAFATLKFSMCGQESWMRHGATFHGDLFTMPLSKDGRTFLFCQF